MLIGAYRGQAKRVILSVVWRFEGGGGGVRPHRQRILEVSSFSSSSAPALLDRWGSVSNSGTSLKAPGVVSLRLDPVPDIKVVYRSTGHRQLINALFSLDSDVKCRYRGLVLDSSG